MHPIPPIAVHMRDERTIRHDVPQPDAARQEGLDSVITVDVPPVNLLLSAAGQFGGNGPQGYFLRKGAASSGSYSLDSVMPGRYWVQAVGQDDYVSSLTSGGNNLAVEPLVVGPESSTAPIEITFRNDWGSIHCTVNAESNGADASGSAANGSRTGEVPVLYAYAIPLVRTANPIPESATQDDQSLTFQKVPPGQYRVVVFDQRQQFNLDDPKAMARLVANGKTVTVEPGGTVNVQLDLTRTRDEEPTQ
jgi:hypothetical protein